MSARRGESGETLIELIVAVAIMGISVVVVVGALAAAVANAGRQRTDARGQAVLNSAAERLRGIPFIPCGPATLSEYNATLTLASPPRDGFAAQITAMKSWNGTAYVDGCPPGAENHQVQLLTLEVTGPATPALGEAQTYEAALTLAKRGPLQVPKLSVPAPAVVDPAPAIAGREIDELRFRADIQGGTPAPRGTMTFSLFGPAPSADEACTVPPLATASAPVTGNGSVLGTLPDYTPPRAGTYYWVASYGGDSAHEGATVVCGPPNQEIVVGKATPTLTATVSPETLRAGETGTVTATLSGGLPAPDAPGGTMRLQLFELGPRGDCETDVIVDTTAPVTAGVATTDPVPFDEPGRYAWRVEYLGDDNHNAAVPIECGPDAPTVTVDP